MKTIVLTDSQLIEGLTKQEREILKQELTFPNPAYSNAVKYGRSTYISIPRNLEYFDELTYLSPEGIRKKRLRIPIGVDVENILEESFYFEDCRVEPEAVFPRFSLSLREDQEKAAESYLESVREKDVAPSLISLPTGKGKTITALYIAGELKVKTLILVHKNDLVVGWQKDIQKCYPGMDVGLIKAKSRKIGDEITIATVQTLSRMSEEERESLMEEFGLVVQDECHHIGLNIFNIIGSFNSKYKLGLSATPVRNDGLNFVFQLYLGGLCYSYKEKATQKGDNDISSVEVRVLNSPAVFRPCVGEDGELYNALNPNRKIPDNMLLIEGLPYERRPKVPFQIADDVAVGNPKTMELVCGKILKEYRMGRSVLVLFTQKKHIEMYAQFLSSSLNNESDLMLYYGDSREDSETLMERAENKDALITLATYAKASEGTNVRAWEVLFLVSSRNNEKDIEQATGRIRRRKKGKIDPVIVYDVKFPYCYMLRSHHNSHQRAYSRLGYKGDVHASGMFNRGYNKG